MELNFEQAIKVIVKAYFGERKINILEAGCAEGGDTREFCHLLPNATIYGFEPDPRLYEEIQQKTATYNNLKFFDLALSDTVGETSFHLANREVGNDVTPWGSSSLLEPKLHKEFHEDIKFTSSITVKTTDIDSWAKSNNVNSIEFMWLDLQGAEPLVLKNCNILSTTSMVFSEVSLIELYDGCVLYKDYAKMMDEKGFVPIIEQLPWEDAGNILFVKANEFEKLFECLKKLGLVK
jgi:2-O-methyltransferase